MLSIMPMTYDWPNGDDLPTGGLHYLAYPVLDLIHAIAKYTEYDHPSVYERGIALRESHINQLEQSLSLLNYYGVTGFTWKRYMSLNDKAQDALRTEYKKYDFAPKKPSVTASIVADYISTHADIISKQLCPEARQIWAACLYAKGIKLLIEFGTENVFHSSCGQDHRVINSALKEFQAAHVLLQETCEELQAAIAFQEEILKACSEATEQLSQRRLSWLRSNGYCCRCEKKLSFIDRLLQRDSHAKCA